jgi:urease accessory protein
VLAASGTDLASASLSGLASLVFRVRGGRTRLMQSKVRPPLMVQRALYLDQALPDMAFVFLANPTAGILEGDQQSIEVNVGPNCRVHVSTQSATKIYSMSGGSARQSVSLVLQDGAYLEYLPDPVIPFSRASFAQDTVTSLAPGASLVFGEVIAPGRVEMGEVLAFDQLQNRLTVLAPNGDPIYRESFSLAPRKHSLSGIGLLGQLTAPSLGTMLLLNSSGDLEKLSDGVRARVGPLVEGLTTIRAGVTLLPNGLGIGVKVLGEPLAAVKEVMKSVWAESRRQVLRVDLPHLRKY